MLKKIFLLVGLLFLLFSLVCSAEPGKITHTTNWIFLTYVYNGKDLDWDWIWGTPQMEPIIKDCPAAMDTLRNAKITRIVWDASVLTDVYFMISSLQNGKADNAVWPTTAAVLLISVLQGIFISGAVNEYNKSVDKQTSAVMPDTDAHKDNMMKVTVLEGKF